jgi:hypothetical protein
MTFPSPSPTGGCFLCWGRCAHARFAAAADASTKRAYWQVSSALPFMLMSDESFGRLHLGGAPGAQRCPLPVQGVPVSFGRVLRDAVL